MRQSSKNLCKIKNYKESLFNSCELSLSMEDDSKSSILVEGDFILCVGFDFFVGGDWDCDSLRDDDRDLSSMSDCDLIADCEFKLVELIKNVESEFKLIEFN